MFEGFVFVRTYCDHVGVLSLVRKSSFIRLIVVVMMLGFASSCSQKTAEMPAVDGAKRPFLIGYCLNSIDDVFQIQVLDAVKKAVVEAGGTIEISNADNDVTKQRNQVASFTARKVDGLIVVPINEETVTTSTAIAQNAGIPLCYINRNPYSDTAVIPRGVYVVSSEESLAGRLQAAYLGTLVNGQGKIVILMGPQDQRAAVERFRGNKEALQAEYPDITILTAVPADWQRTKAFSIMEAIIDEYGMQLSAVLANNDEMAIGAIKALKASGREGVVVVGMDGTIEGKAAIQAGQMAGTVLQDSEMQGKTAAEIIIDVIHGKERSNVTITPVRIIDKGSLASME